MKWTKTKLNNYYAITTIEQLQLEKAKLYRKVKKREEALVAGYDSISEPFRVLNRITNAITQFAQSYWAIGISLAYKWVKQYLANRFAQTQQQSAEE